MGNGKDNSEDVLVKYDRKKFDFFKYMMRNLSANVPKKKIVVDLRGYDTLFYNERAVLAGLMSAVKLSPSYSCTRLSIYVNNDRLVSDLKSAIGLVKDLEKIVISCCGPQPGLPS